MPFFLSPSFAQLQSHFVVTKFHLNYRFVFAVILSLLSQFIWLSKRSDSYVIKRSGNSLLTYYISILLFSDSPWFPRFASSVTRKKFRVQLILRAELFNYELQSFTNEKFRRQVFCKFYRPTNSVGRLNPSLYHFFSHNFIRFYSRKRLLDTCLHRSLINFLIICDYVRMNAEYYGKLLFFLILF